MIKQIVLIFLAACWMVLLSASPCYLLDNRTPAGVDDLLDDPFLVLRSKGSGPESSMDWQRSWMMWSALESSEILPPSHEDPAAIFQVIPEEPGTLIVTSPPSFYDSKSTFLMKFEGEGSPPEQLWWQISSDSHFKTLISNLNQCVPYSMQVQLTSLQEMFLNPDQTYYFRACTDRCFWSNTMVFTVKKPCRIDEVEFEKLGPNQLELCWKADPSPTVNYYVFASNAWDFIPSIYFDQQINCIGNGEILDVETTMNLLTVTTEPHIVIDGSYAYYRIIPCDHGTLGVPSSLIYIYDRSLKNLRTYLKQEDGEKECFQRSLVPSLYADEPISQLPLFSLLTQSYPYNPHVSPSIWEELEPYFLPDNHPIAAKLARLCKKSRFIESKITFEKAGFGKARMRQPTNIIMGKHRDYSGYLFKVYLDAQPPVCEWCNWLNRIRGASGIRECIRKHGFQHFCVPKKWIYPVPAEPSPSPKTECNRKNFFLIVEDMHLVNHKENLEAFRNKITSQMLDELYTILDEEGLFDSVYPDNIPFTKKGKMAFIDTEHHHGWPIQYNRLTRHFSPDMQRYWNTLISGRDQRLIFYDP